MKQYTRIFTALGLIFATALMAPAPAAAQDVSGAQRRGAADYLAAAASGNAQAIAFAVHPDELDRLRLGILAVLREDAAKGDNSRRARLFGAATGVQDVERLTSLNFFQAIARRGISVRGRPYEDLKGIAAIRDGNQVHVVVKGIQPKDRGKTQVVEVVTLLPYGKDWKAAMPSDIEAQIEDLMEGRGPAAARAAAQAAGAGANAGGSGAGAGANAGTGAAPGGSAGQGGGVTAAGAAAGAGAAAPAARNSPEILSLLASAEKALIDGRCDDYYKDHLSPTFRKTLSSKMLGALVNGCRNGLANRELLIAALRIVRRQSPRYEYGDSRATYDVSGQGLPYDQFVLEKVEGRWYIAE
jgi:hypothetical protein